MPKHYALKVNSDNVFEKVFIADEYKKYSDEIYKEIYFSTNKQDRLNVKSYPKSKYKYFAYAANCSHHCNESINHNFIKNELFNTTNIDLLYMDMSVKLIDCDFEVEENIENKFKIDVVLRFKQSMPCEYAFLWRNKLYIEIKFTHGAENDKITYFKTNNLALCEIDFSKRKKFPVLTLEDVMEKKSNGYKAAFNILNYIRQNGVYINMLSNPAMSLEKEIRNLKEENILLKRNYENAKTDFVKANHNYLSLIKENHKLKEESERIKADNKSLLNQFEAQIELLENLKNKKFYKQWYKNIK